MNRKVGKEAALKRWRKINPSDELAAKILQAIETQIAQHHFSNERGERYVPNPATWLHEGRWEDDLADPVDR